MRNTFLGIRVTEQTMNTARWRPWVPGGSSLWQRHQENRVFWGSEDRTSGVRSEWGRREWKGRCTEAKKDLCVPSL